MTWGSLDTDIFTVFLQLHILAHWDQTNKTNETQTPHQNDQFFRQRVDTRVKSLAKQSS